MNRHTSLPIPLTTHTKRTTRLLSLILVCFHVSVLCTWLYLSRTWITQQSRFWYFIRIVLIWYEQYMLWFTATHLAVHGTLFFSKKWDKQFAHCCGALMMVQSWWYYQHIHTLHHKHTKDKDLDPGEDEYHIRWLQSTMKQRYLLYIHPFVLMFTWKELGRIFEELNNRKNMYSLLHFRTPLLILTILWWQVHMLFFIRIVPLLTIRFLFFYRSEIGDHRGENIWTRNPIQWIIYRLLKWPLWFYDGYHELHHLYPHIPRWMLPQIYKQHKKSHEFQDRSSLHTIRWKPYSKTSQN